MIPAHFHRMLWAELRAVFGRWSGKMALGLALLVALGSLAAMQGVRENTIGANFNGMPVESMIDFSWRGVTGWSLKARNFFVLPMLLVLASAAAISGELRDHTLREAMVRPVPRWSIVAAKLLALATLSGTTLLTSLIPSLAGGAIMFGTEAEISTVLLGFLASWGSDIGLFAMTFAVAFFMRSVGGVVVILVLYLMVDMGARGALGLLGAFNIEWAGRVSQMLPGAALACWEGWSSEWAWEPFAGLAVLITVCLSVALLRFQRMDVP